VVLAANAASSVDTVIGLVRRGAELERLAESVDVDAITAAYKQAQRDATTANRRGPIPEDLADTLDSLRRQHRSAQHVLNALDDLDGRLGELRARLRELVLATAELALGGSEAAMDAVERRVEELALDASALRAALLELS